MHNSFYAKERQMKTIGHLRYLPQQQYLDGNRSQDKYIGIHYRDRFRRKIIKLSTAIMTLTL